MNDEHEIRKGYVQRCAEKPVVLNHFPDPESNAKNVFRTARSFSDQKPSG